MESTVQLEQMLPHRDVCSSRIYMYRQIDDTISLIRWLSRIFV